MNTEITAMQELQDIITSRIHDADDELKNKLSFLHSWIVTHGLKIERRHLIDAYHINPKESKYGNVGVDYYNETFKKQNV